MTTSWKNVHLGDCSEILFSNVDKKSDDTEEIVRLCNYMDVYRHRRILGSMTFMQATATPNEISKFSLKGGDVLITKDSEAPDDIAIPSFLPEAIDNLICGYHLAIIRPKPETLDSEFLLHYLQSHAAKKHFFRKSKGVTRFALSTGDVQSLEIKLPPLKEQKKIAGILSTWDLGTTLTRRRIDAVSKELRLLIDTIFNNDKCVNVPHGWVAKEIQDLADLNPETISEKSDQDSEFYYIDLSCVQRGIVVIPDNRIIFRDAPSRARKKCQYGDILISSVRPNLQGFAIVTDQRSDLVASTGFSVLRPKNPEYRDLIYFSFYGQVTSREIQRLIAGSNYPAINSSDIATLKVIVPDNLNTARKYGELLKLLENEKHSLRTYLTKLQAQKNALMQQLLKAKIRVNK